MTDKPTQIETASFWRSQELLLLQQVASLASKHIDPHPVMAEMLHLLSELLGLNRGRIVLLDEAGTCGSICCAYGLTKEEVKRGCYQLNEGVTGHVLARGQVMIVQDIDKDPLFLGKMVKRENLPAGSVSFIALPIMIGQRVVGVLACHRIRMRARSLSDDLSILRILSTQIGQMLHLQDYLRHKTQALEQQNRMLAQALDVKASRYGIIGHSSELLRAISELERVSDSTASVLLLGESGTGKELFARALHLASPRHHKPFIRVNCAAIPASLFESELFGYEKGAFTGAQMARAGWFEQADKGTIFLDEIGELPLEMQTKLLRTLQEGMITRLGAKSEQQVDVRLVAATNRNLAHEVQEGRFRQDLFYRLNVIPIKLPSLKDRRDDIPALALHFLNRVNQANQRNVFLTDQAMLRLQAHDWPGNIRELGNLIERMVLLIDTPSIDAADIEHFLPHQSDQPIPKGIASRAPEPFRDLVTDVGDTQTIRPYMMVESHRLEDLKQALLQAGGNKTRAAQLLGMSARQFSYRLEKLSA